MFHLKEKKLVYSDLGCEIVFIISFNTLKERGILKEQIFFHSNLKWNIFLQVSGKRYEGKEAENLEGGEYEAAVNQEKEDDRRSHSELVGGTFQRQMGSGGDQEEVNVAALNVRTRHDGRKEEGSGETFSCFHLEIIHIYTDATGTTASFNLLLTLTHILLHI